MCLRIPIAVQITGKVSTFKDDEGKEMWGKAHKSSHTHTDEEILLQYC